MTPSMPRWLRILIKSTTVVLILGLFVFVGVGTAYGDLLKGPVLRPTPDAISLKRVFPPPAGWSETAVAGPRAYADSLASTAIIVLHDGAVIAEWGATDRRTSVHSVRKSLVSALYGIAIDRGLIDTGRTLAELGIDDHAPPLSAVERSARLTDLLTARSGIYHPSVQDDNGPYPAPGSHRPDEAFVYNNWSFNALGGIFERLTGLTLGAAFKTWIADPIGMQDFREEDVRYQEGAESVFPAWRFWMSTRDLARFGQLYLDGGRWNGTQVVPESWVTLSTTARTALDNGTGYGYLWWTMPDSSLLATGTGGQKIRLYPTKRLVIVNKVDTGEGFTRFLWWNWGGRVNNSNLSELRRRLEGALPEVLGGSEDGIRS